MSYNRPLPPDLIAAVRRNPGRFVGRRAIERLGCSSTHITGWRRSGQLERLLPGWYRIAGDAVPRWQHVLVAWAHLNGLRPGAPLRLTGLSALALAGLDVAIPAVPAFLVEEGRRVRLPDPPFTTIRRQGLDQVAGLHRLGMVLQPPGLAVVDAVAEVGVSDDALRSLLYLICNRFRVEGAQLTRTWQQLRPQQVSRLLSLVSDGSLQHESPRERSTFLDVFGDHPPAPDCQVWLTSRIRVDFAFLFAALVLEYHGEDAHRDRVDDDASRIYVLTQLGHEVMVVTKSMTRDRPGLARHIQERRRRREELFLAGGLPRPPLPVQPDRLLPLRTLHPGG